MPSLTEQTPICTKWTTFVHAIDTVPTSMILPRANAQPAIANPKYSENRRPAQGFKNCIHYRQYVSRKKGFLCRGRIVTPSLLVQTHVENRRLAKGLSNCVCRGQ